MGGSIKACTAEDFLEWLKVQSHEIFRGCEDEVACEASAISNVKRRIQFLHFVLDWKEDIFQIIIFYEWMTLFKIIALSVLLGSAIYFVARDVVEPNWYLR